MTKPASLVDGVAPAATVRPGRRWTRLRWLSTLAVAGMVLAVVVPGLLPAGTADPANGVFLPASIVSNAAFPSGVESKPLGTALLLFPSGDGDQDGAWNTFVMGVDGHTYRDLDTGDRIPTLAPDGSAVLLVDPRGRPPMINVDLRTGASRTVPVADGASVLPLAWSPDLRTVAVVVVAGVDNGDLALLDPATGVLAVKPELGRGAVAAAWSADSRELAVQVSEKLVVLDATGSLLREVPLPPHRGLKPGVAWSPDGQWLGTVSYPKMPPVLGSMLATGLELVDATGSGRLAPVLPKPIAVVVGWLGPTRLLQLDFADYPDGAALSEVSFGTGGSPDGGNVRRLARFEEPHICLLLTPCTLDFSLQVATGLLGRVEVRPFNGADWGPSALRWWLGGAVALLWLIGTIFLLGIGRRRPAV